MTRPLCLRCMTRREHCPACGSCRYYDGGCYQCQYLSDAAIEEMGHRRHT